MSLGRCWSRLQAFQTISDGSSSFLGPTFPPNLQNCSSNILRFPKQLLNKGLGFSWINLNNLVGPKLNMIGFGSHGHTLKSEKTCKWWLFGFSQMDLKATGPKRRRIILRSFSGHSFLKIYNKMAPQTPPDPKAGIGSHLSPFPPWMAQKRPGYWLVGWRSSP